MKKGKTKKKTEQKSAVREGALNRHLPAAAFIIIAISVAYANSLNGTWAMDDVLAGKQMAVRDLKDLAGFRTVTALSFSLNLAIAPFSPASLRVFNILLHMANALLVYMLTFWTVSRSREDGGNSAFAAALLAATAFGLHPVNINAVVYIIQRSAALAAFFVLLSLLSYRAGVEAGGRARSVAFFSLSLGLLVAGVLSKENAVMGVPLILLYDFVFIAKADWKAFRRRLFFVLGAGALAVAVLSPWMNFHGTAANLFDLFTHPNRVKYLGWMAVDAYWTPLQHVLTEFRVVSRYLFLVFVPLPNLFVFDWWGYPVSTGLLSPATTLSSILFVFAVAGLAVAGLRRFPFLCFGVLWYLTAISLESFIALGSDLYYEHRNYLPVAGLFAGIASEAATRLKTGASKRTLWAAAGILGVFLAGATMARNTVWKDSLTLWGDALKKNPENIRAVLSLGNTYMKLADMERAKAQYREALRLSNRDRRLAFLDGTTYRLGMVYLFERNLDEAKRLIETMESSVRSYHLKILKGFYAALTGDPDSALGLYHEVARIASGVDKPVVFTLMGDVFRDKGNWDRAIEQYEKALNRDQGFAAAHYGMGMAYLGKRNPDLALRHIDAALAVEPGHVLALSDKADLTLVRKGNPNEALDYSMRALKNSPPFYQPYLTAGSVLTVLGREQEAEAYFRKALERKAPPHLIPLSRARAYYVKGDKAKAQAMLLELQKQQPAGSEQGKGR